MLDMNPDAIFPLSGGTLWDEKSGAWRSTTYEEGDSFGTLGGYARIQAGAILARRYPKAKVVANTKCLDDRLPTHASIHARELEALGVEKERIVLEEKSTTTGTQVLEALALAESQGWKNILFVSNEYHIPRVQAFYEKAKSNVQADSISAESILIAESPGFKDAFEIIQKKPAYRLRLKSEAEGLEALRKGVYQAPSVESKREQKQ